ncbi:MAG: hypothetical protein IJ496_05510 [Ruminococcus sp.]|nr:hypothetical protein [Ruminococcus sp.]
MINNRILCITLGLALSAGMTACSSLPADKDDPAQNEIIISTGYVNIPAGTDCAILHSEQSEESDGVAQLHHNDPINILSLNNGWFYVEFQSFKGYVQGDFVAFSEKPAATTTTTTTATTTTATAFYEVFPTMFAYVETVSNAPYDGSKSYLYAYGDFEYIEVTAYDDDDNEWFLGTFPNNNGEAINLGLNAIAIPETILLITPYNSQDMCGNPIICYVPSEIT